jgi:DNA-binding NarL/FixJ family response regulator
MVDEPIRVLVVDDQRLIRESIASLLNIQPGIHVVGTACDGHDAIDKADALGPDVVLMDVRMPTMDGVAATAALTARSPDCRVVMLTTFDDEEYVVQALRAGAAGYLLKDLPASELANAVRLVYAGVTQLDATAAAHLTAALSQHLGSGSANMPRDGLSEISGETSGAGPGERSGDGPHDELDDGPGANPGAGLDESRADRLSDRLARETGRAGRAFGAAGTSGTAVDHPEARDGTLTSREIDVLRLVAQGWTNREIAARLYLSEGTVKNHISRVLGRLGLRDRTQAALYARDHGLL